MWKGLETASDDLDLIASLSQVASSPVDGLQAAAGLTAVPDRSRTRRRG